MKTGFEGAFISDQGTHGIILTGMKYRLQNAVVGVLTRRPSHMVNKYWVGPVMTVGMRVMGVPKEDAREVSAQYQKYMGKAIDAQCDAFVMAPLGKKMAAALEANFREDVLEEVTAWINVATAALHKTH